MATANQAAATFLSFLSSSHHQTAPTSSSVSFLATPAALPASLRAAAVGGPALASRCRSRRVVAAVAQLPTANPELASGEKKIRWSSRAVRSFAMAELEARKMRYPTTGTEGLLMGILVEGTSDAAKIMRANGITLLTVRDAAAEVLGKSEMFYFSPMHPPLTESAQRALDWAVNEKLKSDMPFVICVAGKDLELKSCTSEKIGSYIYVAECGFPLMLGEDGEVTANHLFLAIWSDKESAGHKVLASLGFDDEKASLLAKTAGEEATMSPR